MGIILGYDKIPSEWSRYIDEMIELSSNDQVYFASHHWPVWGKQRIRSYLEQQRDTYKYIHDQTVRLFNDGYTPREIAEQLELPAALQAGCGLCSTLTKPVYNPARSWSARAPIHLGRRFSLPRQDW